MPFKSVVNEYYARDISKKVRSAYRTKALNGEFIGSYAPYGYRKNPENKHQLIINEDTVGIVRRIFQMAVDGLTPFKIANTLSKEEILTPRAYLANKEGVYKNCYNPKYPTDWCNTTIMAILQNRVYLGHIVAGKSTTKSFKNRKQVPIAKEEWIETKNTHEPIIDEYMFERAQKMVGVRKVRNTSGRVNIFAGLLKCSDCGGGLNYVKKTGTHEGSYNCNLYRKKSTKYCTAHYITHKALYKLVLDDIREKAKFAKEHEEELCAYALKLSNGNVDEKSKRLDKELEKLKKREEELDIIFKKLFEQSALGMITDERFITMTAGYETEQQELSEKIMALQSQLDEQKALNNNTKRFLEIVHKYSEITELDSTILNDLIESIVIYNAESKSRKNRKQRVDINYKFVGLMQMGN